MWINIRMTNIKNNIGVFTVSQCNPCEQLVFIKYHLIKTFLINLNWFPKNNNGYFVAYFYYVCDWNLVWHTLCDMTVVTKEKQSGHMTPWDNGEMFICNHAVTRGSLGTISSINLDSICLFVSNFLSEW